jgi:Mandelate racemase / muconate lactonizing enzyme, N-terminal domain
MALSNASILHSPTLPLSSRRAVLRCTAISTRHTPTRLATTSFCFDSLKETSSIDVARAEGRPLDVPLLSPFTIASSRLDKVTNVAIRVELRNGNVGWGEAPVLPSVTAEDQKTALEAAADACDLLVKSRPMNLGAVLAEVDRLLPGHDFASVRSLF